MNSRVCLRRLGAFVRSWAASSPAAPNRGQVDRAGPEPAARQQITGLEAVAPLTAAKIGEGLRTDQIDPENRRRTSEEQIKVDAYYHRDVPASAAREIVVGAGGEIAGGSSTDTSPRG